MATAYEVDQWKDRCRRLTALLDKSRNEKEALTRRIRDNSEETKAARAIADGLAWEVEDIKAENEKLRALVSDMLRTYRNVGMICEGCGYEMGCDGTDCQGDEYSLFLGRARELGIGVDG